MKASKLISILSEDPDNEIDVGIIFHFPPDTQRIEEYKIQDVKVDEGKTTLLIDDDNLLRVTVEPNEEIEGLDKTDKDI